MKRICFVVVLFGLGAVGCSRVSHEDARGLVEQYARSISEAYRRGDVELIDSIVAPDSVEGKNLTGLIGVRIDLGITMDAEMLALEIKKVEEDGGSLRVNAFERWRYRDLEIGTGEQVGEESTDSYELLYIFRRVGNRWMVEETKFAGPPVVGRKEVPWKAESEVMHGVMSSTGDREGAQQ